MQQLSQAIVRNPDTALPERILQFGEGNFLRAFIDWMVQRMNRAGLFQGRVVVVQPLPEGLVDTLNAQQGLYTLYLRGLLDGETVSEHELITSVSRGIDPYRDWDAFLETARDPLFRFVVSNTTEAGIELLQTPMPDGTCPASFPAKLTAWLVERFTALGGTTESGVIVLPCELIERNGQELKRCVLRHAQDWEVAEPFFWWLENACFFLDTLVDRIVPGYPRDEVEGMQAELGYEDKLLCTGEIFHLLVVEGPEALRDELPLDQAGLNVLWCDDLERYRTRKVGILNGAHTSSVLAAYLGGLDTVREMMEDRDFGRFVRQAVFDEIVPVLPMDRVEAESFAEAVMERFRNPYIRHELLTISLNSVSKWRVRVLPSVKRFVEKFGQTPRCLSFSLAALIAFYRGEPREGIAPRDEDAVIDFFRSVWQEKQPASVVHAVLGREEFWGEDLTRLENFGVSVTETLNDILTIGMRPALRKLLDT